MDGSDLIHVFGKSEIRNCLAPNVSEDASKVVDINSGGGQWQKIPQEEGGAVGLAGDGGWRLYSRARNLLRQHE